MEPAKHMRGLQSDLNHQLKMNKGKGPSDALKKIMKRPGGVYNPRKTRRDGYCCMGDIDQELQPKKKWNWKKCTS